MELLLNLIWLAVAAGVPAAFVLNRRRSAWLAQVPFGQALVALACVVVLLFPIVSASDDLHPTQAVVEDASKRVQLAVAPLHLLQADRPLSVLLAKLAFYLISALVVLEISRLGVIPARLLDGTIIPSAGRAPPSCWN
jgi:hypothetical protein